MADEKIILAHCSRTGKKFCIEVRKKNGRYEAVNFIDLSDADYGKLTSEVSCENLISADNLIACRYCKSRKISGCSCNSKRKQCRTNDKYDFQCLYCDLLSIDQPQSARQKIYVTSKHYDDIGEVLRSMKLSYEAFSGKYDCDILFLNCGTSDYIDPKKLASFVNQGGCLYASDLASSHIQAAFPGMITFNNNGSACKIYADVVDQELLQITGKQIEITFDLGSWSVLDRTKGTVLLRGSQGNAYSGKPIMISFKYGKGVVFYTSFHNHAQASEKEKMLLQLLLLKQMGAQSNQSIEQIGDLMGLNIASMRDRFKRS